MLSKEKLEQLMAILGDLTEEQKAIVTEALKRPIKEKELFEKLGVDEGKVAEFMRAVAAGTEDAVLEQELSLDEMDAAAGDGGRFGKVLHKSAPEVHNCTENSTRSIYEGAFPNCAATVEDGSWCGTNDACYDSAVKYVYMTSCIKAWR